MPAAATSRQPGAPSWFSGIEAQALLADERRWAMQRLAELPLAPCLWIGPVPAGTTLPAPLRGLALSCSDGQTYVGGVRCSLPLPLHGACIGALVLQHAAGGTEGALLDEAARLLVDGGRVWVFGLTPWSPFRLRWRGSGLAACPPARWRARLAAVGLTAGPACYLGARWRAPATGAGGAGIGDALRGAYVVEAQKRVAIPPTPMPVQWRRSAPAAG